jgi:hypothetical protein
MRIVEFRTTVTYYEVHEPDTDDPYTADLDVEQGYPADDIDVERAIADDYQFERAKAKYEARKAAGLLENV